MLHVSNKSILLIDTFCNFLSEMNCSLFIIDCANNGITKPIEPGYY